MLYTTNDKLDNLELANANQLLKEKTMKKRERIIFFLRLERKQRLDKAEQGRPKRSPFAVSLRGRGHPIERVVKTQYSRKDQRHKDYEDYLT